MDRLNINLPPVRIHCLHVRPCCYGSCFVLPHNPTLQSFAQWQEAWPMSASMSWRWQYRHWRAAHAPPSPFPSVFLLSHGSKKSFIKIIIRQSIRETKVTLSIDIKQSLCYHRYAITNEKGMFIATTNSSIFWIVCSHTMWRQLHLHMSQTHLFIFT